MIVLSKRLAVSDDAGFLFLADLFQRQGILLYAVGGSVRDCLELHFDAGLYPADLKNPSYDIDLAVPVPPHQVCKVLQEHDIRTITVGIDYGTVVANILGKNYEITSFRQDIQTDGRYARVSYTDDMLSDAHRRDFTINALYYSPQHVIYDPTELGISDLKNRNIRFIGDPHQRIQEDYLRILRYFRFLVKYDFKDFDSLLFQKNDYSKQIEGLSRERVTQEILNILQYSQSYKVFEMMIDLKLNEAIFCSVVLNSTLLKEGGHMTDDSIFRFAMLVSDSSFDAVKKNFRLSNLQLKKLHKFHTFYACFEKLFNQKTLDHHSIIQLLSLKYDSDANSDRLIFDLIVMLFKQRFSQYNDILNTINIIPMQKISVTGNHLSQQGFLGIAIKNELLRHKELYLQELYEKYFYNFSCDSRP